MAKAAKTVSWRTLMRRAKDEEKAGHNKVAASLRAQAADMRKGTRSKLKPATKVETVKARATKRRSSVAKKGWATRRAKKLVVADALAPMAEAQAINAVRDDWQRLSGVSARLAPSENMEAPGRGEIVGGAEHQFAEEIAKLARKKGGKDAIQNMITERIAVARAEGQRLADEGSRQVREEMLRIHNEQIVCAFLSEIDVHERADELRPNSSPWTVSALTLTKVAAALRGAGYTSQERDPHRGN